MIIGICLGPIAANFINSKNWGLKEEGQQYEITLVSSSTGSHGLSLTNIRASLESSSVSSWSLLATSSRPNMSGTARRSSSCASSPS